MSEGSPRVLVVDDDPIMLTTFSRVLAAVSEEVVTAASAEEALAQLQSGRFDVVVSDIQMPGGASGTDLLRAARARDIDLPVIFVTGMPSLESASAAVELGAFRYLGKPIDAVALCEAVERAAKLRALAHASSPAVARAALEVSLRSAIASMRMVYQPILDVRSKSTTAFEALMRSSEPSLPSPPAVLAAAEKLGALHVLGRHVRGLVAADAERAPEGTSLFVNLHSADLADPELYDPASPLSRHASRVVLEITERASLEGISDVQAKRDQLKAMGYRLAVDDLGAGYAGLSYFARIRPEIVKIDMSLVRGVDQDDVKARVVASLAGLAFELGMLIVAEGVETPGERDVVCAIGCTLLQGWCFAKPGPPFPASRWGD